MSVGVDYRHRLSDNRIRRVRLGLRTGGPWIWARRDRYFRSRRPATNISPSGGSPIQPHRCMSEAKHQQQGRALPQAPPLLPSTRTRLHSESPSSSTDSSAPTPLIARLRKHRQEEKTSRGRNGARRCHGRPRPGRAAAHSKRGEHSSTWQEMAGRGRRCTGTSLSSAESGHSWRETKAQGGLAVRVPEPSLQRARGLGASADGGVVELCVSLRMDEKQLFHA